jgi:hypothetical protein
VQKKKKKRKKKKKEENAKGKRHQDPDLSKLAIARALFLRSIGIMPSANANHPSTGIINAAVLPIQRYVTAELAATSGGSRLDECVKKPIVGDTGAWGNTHTQ